ncbi:nucleic acid dioxygenase ALKBH1 [Diorhabda sublineata]|uniref:nucleic acid dioxygenase ALKBH1 n=1 Tax=Diorhabda sublineata TaxID=1163346 RepID=UPI0024E191D1|nr:nucleic acid dioxygenase ALKBH1 [Diorhabda sublineata]
MFRESFKYYKSKDPLPTFEDVLNIHKPKLLLNNGIITKLDINKSSPQYGLRSTEDWEVYVINSRNGLIFIKNPFTPHGQRYWITRCLKDYSKKPHKLNIDNTNILKSDENWWEEGRKNKKIIDSLRWSTFGYHHDWDTKIYSEENKCPFPEDIKNMTKYVAEQFGFDDFTAEAAIINYYHLDSTLSGHTDHSEQNLEAPLFSFSFGQSAIFLIGGETIDEKPLAMYIHSGDILIMSKESRLCYHAVPRIIKTNYEVWNDEYQMENSDFKHWEPFNNYLNYSRININVRQVLNKGQLKL